MTTNRDASHLAQEQYDSLAAVLRDIERVSHDIRGVMSGQLVVAVDDIDFMSRRVEHLASGAVDHISRLQLIPHHARTTEAVGDQ
jgi:hypothetical protein